MQQSLIEKAAGRLRSAQRAVVALAQADELYNQYDHWVEFLVAWKGVYSQLQQAAKSTPQEMQWFGKINAERKKDTLLMYLYEARNDEEHGTNASVNVLPGKAKIKIEHDVRFSNIKIEDDSLFLVDEQGKVVHGPTPISKPLLLLKPVLARGDRVIKPPHVYDGKPIIPNPLTVAQIGLQYAETLFSRALEMHGT